MPPVQIELSRSTAPSPLRWPSIRLLRCVLRFALALLALLLVTVVKLESAQAATRCQICHAKLPDKRLRAPAEKLRGSAHEDDHLSCSGCHGGDRDDPTVRSHATEDFNRRPTFKSIPALCGRCHADAEFIRRFNASLPIDQLALYKTSGHGKAFAAGDEKIAICTSCHGVHHIITASEPSSPVHPRQITKTCAKCHSKSELMKPYKHPSNQHKLWTNSVHGKGMAAGNMAVPTCKNCHGAHGAAPPALDSVSRVCGRCHQSQLEAFRASPHARPFQKLGFPECVQCHGSHGVEHPTVTHIGFGPDSMCVKCHSEGQKAFTTARKLAAILRDAYAQVDAAKKAIGEAERMGLAVGIAKLKLEHAHTLRLKLRNVLHSFDPQKLSVAAQRVVEATQGATEVVATMLNRQRARRRDYGIIVALVLGYLLLLGVQIRRWPINKPKPPRKDVASSASETSA